MTTSKLATEQSITPKVFISYSWTSPEHAEWVISLASRLRENGIETILDRWHLKSGQDKYKFMERMVTDPTIQKVLMICDKGYANKADKREGGVGDETQIVTPEIYRATDQTKFLPIAAEKDENGEAYKPKYLAGRIHIDLSDPVTFEQGYEDLLRDIVGKPLNVPPPLGELPSFLVDESQKPLPTAHRLNMLRAALLANKATAAGLAGDYLSQLLQELEQFNLQKCGQEGLSLEENIGKCLDDALPYRDQYIEFVVFLARYGSEPRVFESLLQFFSQTVRFVLRPRFDQDRGCYEVYRLLIPELFLYTVAALLQRRHFEAINELLSQRYVDKPGLDGGIVPYNYTVFQPYLPTLEDRPRMQNHRIFNTVGPTAELLIQRVPSGENDRLDIVDADYLLYSRHLFSPEPNSLQWVSMLRPYMNQPGPMPFFVNAQARTFFGRAKVILNVQDKQDLLRKFEAAAARVPAETLRYEQRPLARDYALMDINNLDTV